MGRLRLAFWIGLGSGPVALVVLALGTLAPAVVEKFYSRGFYPWLTVPLSRLSALVPFPLAPVLLVLGVGAAVGAFFFYPKAWMGVAAALSFLLAWFVLGWGLNYQRLSWADNQGWTVRGGTVTDLESLAKRLATRAGPLRQQAWKDGTPPWAALLSKGIPLAYGHAAQRWPILAGRYPGPKAAPVSLLFSWLGISGIYLPFTAEPLVNTGPQSWSLPFTAAHESAHLHGWAREDEANFLAFLVLADCGDARLEYSAWSMALLYVAGSLNDAGPAGVGAWKAITASLPHEVLDDWKAYFGYWERFKGPLQQAAQAVNDTYLKAQGQADGVKSYGRMVDLLLAWETLP